MKTWLIPVIIIVIAIFVIYGFTVGLNNTAIEKEENVKLTWAHVESSYQRRNDLIGNLVQTVQGAADFERGTLTDVIEARSRATSVNVDAGDLDPQQIQQFQEA